MRDSIAIGAVPGGFLASLVNSNHLSSFVCAVRRGRDAAELAVLVGSSSGANGTTDSDRRRGDAAGRASGSSQSDAADHVETSGHSFAAGFIASGDSDL